MTKKLSKTEGTKQIRLFDIKKESERIAIALKNLKETQKPGEASGLGTKTTILMQREDEIRALHLAGYTVQQIAKAMSNDAFGILPKSVTQLLNKHTTSHEKQVKKVATPTVKKETTTDIKAPVIAHQKTNGITEIGDVE